MNKRAFIAALTLLVLGVCVAAAAQDDAVVLKFNAMAPVTGAFVGAAHPVRNIPGGGIPWRLRRAEGIVKQNGELHIEVRGLVLAAGPNAGTNPIGFFVATLSCLQPTLDAGTPPQPAVVNVTTQQQFVATATGDADIEAKDLPLPATCVAPIVFVGPAVVVNGEVRQRAWFAATGY